MTVLVRPRRVADPAVRVVVIHHAGGSSAAVHPLTHHQPDDRELLMLDLPGRGKRHTEAPLDDRTKLAVTAADAVAPWAAASAAGALRAQPGRAGRVRDRTHAGGEGLAPLWGGVSGRPAPGVIGGGGALHPAMTDDHIMDRLTG